MPQNTLFNLGEKKQAPTYAKKWSFQVIANGDLAVDGELTSDNLTDLCRYAEKLIRKEA